MADEVQINFGANTAQAEAGIQHIGNKLRDLNPAVREVAEGFGELRKTFIEAFAIREISEFISHIAELGEEAIRSSEMLGISVEKAQELGFAARSVGGSTEGMTVALTRLERNMAEAGDSTSMAAKAFTALGLSVSDLKNKSPDQVIALIADSFHGAEDGADKTAIAMELMGRSGAQMIPLLNQGSEALRELGAIADKTGSVLKDVKAEGLAQTEHGLVTLKASVEGAGIALFEIFKPAVDGIITGLTQLVQWLTEAFNGLRLITQIIESTLIISLAKAREEFQIFGINGAKYIDEIKIGFQTLGQVIDDVVHLHFDKAVADWDAGSRKIVNSEQQASAAIVGVTQNYVDFKNRVLEATTALFAYSQAEENAGKTKLQAPQRDGKEDHTERDLDRERVSFELEMGKLRLANEKDVLDSKVILGEVTKDKEIAQLKDLAAQEYAIEHQALEDSLKVADLTIVEKKKINDQLLILDQKYANETERLNLKLVEEQKKKWDSYFHSVTSGVDQMVNGVLQGTQTWSQAMGRLFDNLILKFIDDFVVKSITEWAESQVIKLGLQQSFNDAMVALGLEGASTEAAAKKGVEVASNVSTITADSAVAFAGVFANQAPFLGPLAIGPAAAAQETVLAQIPLASYAFGTNYVPQTGLYELHQGERVVPSAQNTNAGGDHYNISISLSAIDTQTGSAFLKNNAGVIAKAITTEMRNNNRNLINSVRG